MYHSGSHFSFFFLQKNNLAGCTQECDLVSMKWTENHDVSGLISSRDKDIK